MFKCCRFMKVCGVIGGVWRYLTVVGVCGCVKVYGGGGGVRGFRRCWKCVEICGGVWR